MRCNRRRERQSINRSAFCDIQILNETDGIMELTTLKMNRQMKCADYILIKEYGGYGA